jgi:chaperonin GroES
VAIAKKKKTGKSAGLKPKQTKGSVKKVVAKAGRKEIPAQKAFKKVKKKKSAEKKIGKGASKKAMSAVKKAKKSPAKKVTKKTTNKAAKKVSKKVGKNFIATKAGQEVKSTATSKKVNKRPSSKLAPNKPNDKKIAGKKMTSNKKANAKNPVANVGGKKNTLASKGKMSPASALAKVKKALAETPLTSIPWSEFISPIADRVLLVTDKQEEVTPGGLILPDMARSDSNKATVVAVGPGRRSKKGFLTPPDVRVGDRVLIQKYTGNKLNLRGESVLLVKESDIIGVVSN